MALNKFLRESIKQKVGIEFLTTHAISEIPFDVMKQIKNEAFEKYLPNNQRPIKAWGLAMASLRCLKRDLVKHKNKQLISMNSLDSTSNKSVKKNGGINLSYSATNAATTNINTTRRKFTIANTLSAMSK